MKKLSFVLFACLFMVKLDVMANDHSMSEEFMEDEFEKFAAIHFSEPGGVFDPECSFTKIMILDFKGNVLRQSDFSSDCLKSKRSILWPLINRSQYLTEVNGILFYLFDEFHTQ